MTAVIKQRRFPCCTITLQNTQRPDRYFLSSVLAAERREQKTQSLVLGLEMEEECTLCNGTYGYPWSSCCYGKTACKKQPRGTQ